MEPEEEGTKNKELVQLEPREAHSFSRWRDGGRKMIVQHMDYDAIAMEARDEHEKIASLSHLARSSTIQLEDISRVWSSWELDEIGFAGPGDTRGGNIRLAVERSWRTTVLPRRREPCNPHEQNERSPNYPLTCCWYQPS